MTAMVLIALVLDVAVTSSGPSTIARPQEPVAHRHDHGPGHASAHPRPATPSEPCACVEARRVHGWCPACATGHVAGVAIRSPALFEALDPHGHGFDPASLRCASCRRALRCDGFCSGCRRGFLRSAMYMTKLTYLLACGRTVNDDECRQHGDPPGTPHWCRERAAGMVGNVAFDDPLVWAQAAGEYRRLRRAVDVATRCELCAVAIFTTAACPHHGPPVE